MSAAQDSRCLVIKRPVLTQTALEEKYGYLPPQPEEPGVRFRNAAQKVCSKRSAIAFVSSFVPIVTWLSNYNIANLLPDFLAGLTCGIMHIPQGMGYSQLAAQDPIYGMYTSFFPALVYLFFGTSRHSSIGTVAVISLMVGQTRYKFCPIAKSATIAVASVNGTHNYTNVQASMLSEAYAGAHVVDYFNATADHSTNTTGVPFYSCNRPGLTPPMVAATLTFCVGLCQLFLGMMRLGFLSVFMSDQLISGYTCGAAVMVATAQMDKIFGVKLDAYADFGKLYFTYKDLILRLPQTNIATLVMFLICAIALIINKEWFNPWFKKKCRFDFPMDLVALIIGTLLSYYCKFHARWTMKTVGKIPAGMPKPVVPRLDLVPDMIGDIISLTIVCFAISLSMAKIFSKRHRYPIDANQELNAYGLSNSIASFFGAFASGASVSRSSVNELAGCKTQLSAIFSCGVMFFVLLFIGPLFEELPQCVLSAIIVVAVKGLLWQIKELKYLWPRSKIDFSIWVVSFLATCACDVTYGLLISIVYGIITVIWRSMRVSSSKLGHVTGTEFCKYDKDYTSIEEPLGVKIFRFDAPIFYANASIFQSRLYQACQIEMTKILMELDKAQRSQQKNQGVRKSPKWAGSLASGCAGVLQKAEKLRPNRSVQALPVVYSTYAMHTHQVAQQTMSVSSTAVMFPSTNEQKLQAADVLASFCLPKYVIVDASGINYIDVMGMDTLRDTYTALQNIRVDMLIAGCKEPVLEFLNKSPEVYKKLPKSIFFASSLDAVEFARQALGQSKQEDISFETDDPTRSPQMWYWPD